jgi:hypothetical protein
MPQFCDNCFAAEVPFPATTRMTFSPRLIEARLALNMIHPEDFPMLVITALEADLDDPTIRRMSILTKPSRYTTDLLRERFMTEAGLVTYPKTQRAHDWHRNWQGKRFAPARTHCNLQEI